MYCNKLQNTGFMHLYHAQIPALFKHIFKLFQHLTAVVNYIFIWIHTQNDYFTFYHIKRDGVMLWTTKIVFRNSRSIRNGRKTHQFYVSKCHLSLSWLCLLSNLTESIQKNYPINHSTHNFISTSTFFFFFTENVKSKNICLWGRQSISSLSFLHSTVQIETKQLELTNKQH